MTSNPVFGAYKGKNHLCLRLKHFIDFEPKLSARAPCSALEKSLGNLGLGRWTPVWMCPCIKVLCLTQGLPARQGEGCGHDGEPRS